MAEADYEPPCKSSRPGGSRREESNRSSVAEDDEDLYEIYRRSGRSFLEFTEGQEFLNALPQPLRSFLKRDELLADTEEDIYFALERWYKVQPYLRYEGYLDALPAIRFALVSSPRVTTVDNAVKLIAPKHTEYLRSEFFNYHWAFARRRILQKMWETKPRTSRGDLKKYLYVLGAPRNEEQSLQCYDICSNTWTLIEKKIPIARTDAGIAAFNECVWVAGGRSVKEMAALNSVCAYDPISQIWSDKEPMNRIRVGCGLATYEGKLYAVGGRNDVDGPLDTSEIYDGSGWTDGASMTKERFDLELVSECGRLFAAGGMNRTTESSNHMKTLECYGSTKQDHWCSIPGERLVRESGRLVAMHGILYCVAWNRKSSVIEFHALANHWNSISPQTLRTPRKQFAATAADGIIYVVGGSIKVDGVFQETKSLQSFNPATGETKDLADTIEPPGPDVRAVIIKHPTLPGSSS